MTLFGRLSLSVLASAAFVAPTSSNAAIVSVSQQKLNECGRGFVFCNGRQAYSLSEIESGALQIPVFPLLPSEVVIVNDTGATVTDLQFTLTTLQILSFDMQCLIAPSARSLLAGCTVAKISSGFNSDPFHPVAAQFTYSADHKKGIANGDYFDLTTVGFLPGGYICGGSGGNGNGSGSGSGNGSGSGSGTGNPAPPEQ
ncbi:MAG TPA: hypothetical protein VGM11_01555 [Acidobacteriaceae bacterium]|jgi:hypothetical protein